MEQPPAIQSHPSPNFGPRRDSAHPSLVVLHYTAMNTAEAALERLCDPDFEVSAHYLISRHGQVFQLVNEAQRAWHAGAGEWDGCRDVNSHSIGIELDNLGTHPYSNLQMAALEMLLPQIMARWSIPPCNVIGHADLAPARKIDPGPRFDWQRLARQGLSDWPTAREETSHNWQSLARRYGYPDDPRAFLAFRARFRPWAKGAQDPMDCEILASLLRTKESLSSL